jgi:hypothetical protein
VASHVPHDDVHEYGLADRCPRCAEIADNPSAFMDDELFRATWKQMVDVEWGEHGYRSDTEGRAGRKLYALAVFMERRLGLDPKTYFAPAEPLPPDYAETAA